MGGLRDTLGHGCARLLAWLRPLGDIVGRVPRWMLLVWLFTGYAGGSRDSRDFRRIGAVAGGRRIGAVAGGRRIGAVAGGRRIVKHSTSLPAANRIRAAEALHWAGWRGQRSDKACRRRHQFLP